MSETFDSEDRLPDNYPVYPSYLYVCDGAVIISWIKGTVGDLRLETGAKEVRHCNIFARQAALAKSENPS